MTTWLTFNLVDCTAGRLTSLLRFFKKPGSGESSPLLPTPPSSAEKAANNEVPSLLEGKKEKKKDVPT